MFAIPVLVLRKDGSSTLYRGSLVNPPPDVLSKGRLAKYEKMRTTGWSKDEFGYHIFAKYDFEGSMIIVPGIILEGERRRNVHKGYDVTFTKAQIEQFVEDISAFERDAFERASQDVNMLVHDLRNISNSIYNSALEADVWINRGKYNEAKARVQNVIAAQGILKIRTDVLDFLGNPASIIKNRSIEVFRRVDKVSRSLKPEAAKKNISIDFSGTCHLLAVGPDIFEVVPFVLIENAIKYSPEGGTISVTVIEQNDEVVLEVTSFGPEIGLDEHEAIFQKGVRGRGAQSTMVPGTGFGLFLLRSLVLEHFGGKIQVEQEPSALSFNNVPMHRTTFRIIIPGKQQQAPRLNRIRMGFARH